MNPPLTRVEDVSMKRILLALFAFFVTCGLAFAAVDINSADETALDAIKGVGPAKAKAIVEERKKNGPFKSLDDVAARVKGIGDKTVAGWKKDGSVSITGGTSAPAKADAKKDAPKADAKKDASKADEKKADAKKSDAKKEAPKADAAKKDAPKADEKKVEEKKADAKK
jgi:competence ComEA-like helix-hairpin-helix protein